MDKNKWIRIFLVAKGHCVLVRRWAVVSSIAFACLLKYIIGFDDGYLKLDLDCNNIQSMNTSAILDTFLTSVGTDGLGCLFMAGNRLPVIPERLIESKFHQLECIYLQFNNNRTLKNGSFNFITKLDHLSLDGNQLNHIEPGAFQGTIIDHQFQIFKLIILHNFFYKKLRKRIGY